VNATVWCLAAALVCVVPGGRMRRRPARRRSALTRPNSLRALGAGAAAAMGWLAVSGSAGIVLGAGCAAAAWWAVGRLPDRSARWSLDELRRVPLVLDLVATVLQTGQPVEAALVAAAPAAGPRVASELGQVGGMLKLGAAPRDAWSSLASTPLQPVAAVAIRSADSGVRLAAGWSELAEELRAEAMSRATARAAAAGTWVIAPLGLCFLPAFVCLGIAPVVLGLVGSLGAL
jgi:Flp pilus assembly protein TadB